MTAETTLHNIRGLDSGVKRHHGRYLCSRRSASELGSQGTCSRTCRIGNRAQRCLRRRCCPTEQEILSSAQTELKKRVWVEWKVARSRTRPPAPPRRLATAFVQDNGGLRGTMGLCGDLQLTVPTPTRMNQSQAPRSRTPRTEPTKPHVRLWQFGRLVGWLALPYSHEKRRLCVVRP